MRIKHFLMIAFLFLIEPVIGCSCFSIDSTYAKEIIKEADYVVIGRAVKNIGFSNEINSMWDSENQGFDILFEVDSVIKGDLISKSLLVKQFGGNCDQIFKFGEQHLVIGNEIEKFVDKTPKQRKSKKGGIQEDQIPPPPPSVYSKTAVFYNRGHKEVNFWNKKAKKSIVITTSMCLTFPINSTLARDFFKK